jgi:uncharacterized membrane protein YfcA
MTEYIGLVVALVLIALVLSVALILAIPRYRPSRPTLLQCGIGLVTDFLDTLGIGSFAVTTSLFKLFKVVPDERIPGTLNAGHALPTVVEALIYIVIVAVEPRTLLLLILAAIAGAWLGAGFVARLPRRGVQIGMGIALLVAAVFFVVKNLKGSHYGLGGDALSLTGTRLLIGIVVNFCLGALMTIGIGLYAPCMIMVSLLGMDPAAAFPIMMGSCAFLMPVASLRFIKLDAISMRAVLGLTLGGIPGVLLAAFVFTRFFHVSMVNLQWLVVVIVLYAGIVMLRSAAQRSQETEYAYAEPKG